jgi:hypothetical protein
MKLSLRHVSGPLLLSVVLSTLIAGCAAQAPTEDTAASEDALRTTYADLVETLDAPDLDRWLTVRAALRDRFAATCSDTHCKGAYANLTHVRLSCSSTRIARKMKDCVWVLGANVDHVDAATGEITSDMRVFTCHVPVAGRADAMLTALEAAGASALVTPLPGTGKSFDDALTTCLEGAEPPEAPPVTKGTFAELGDERWAAGDGPGATWADTKRRLNARFDEACGDTFCEGDYPDVSGLGFSCATDRTTQHVSTCSWSFASADTAVDSRGHITAGTKTTRCTVAIDAQAGALDAALAGEDPLHSPLPNRDTSINDAIIDCL